MLTIVNSKNQIARSFRLTVGLIEGYAGGKLHTQEEVGEIIANWLLKQRQNLRPYLPGSITASTMYYYGREAKKLIVEPIVLYEGDVSPEYNADLDNDDVLLALQELAEILANKLNQTRIYLRYNGMIQILERQG
jgi:predicted transcriptional regulator